MNRIGRAIVNRWHGADDLRTMPKGTAYRAKLHLIRYQVDKGGRDG